MKRSLRGLLALALAVMLLAVSGCMSVKQVKIPEDRAVWLAYGAFTSAAFELSDKHLGGLLGAFKADATEYVNAFGIYDASGAIPALYDQLNTGNRMASGGYVGSDRLLDVAQGLLPTFAISEEEVEYFQSRYESTCNQLIGRYGYTREQLDAVHTTSAFDYDILIAMTRLMFALDFISEEDAWFYIESAATRAAEDYDSWESYAAGIAFGYMLAGADNEMYDVLDQLLLEESSPYFLYEFGS